MNKSFFGGWTEKTAYRQAGAASSWISFA